MDQRQPDNHDAPREEHEALYLPGDADDSSETFVSTALTGGPWRPDAQHGGPPSALLGRALEQMLEPGQFLARVTIELVKGVPLEKLTITRHVQRVSGRVWRAEAAMHCGPTLVARAAGLILKSAEVPEPAWRPEPDVGSRPDRATPPTDRWIREPGVLGYHRDAVEHRFEVGTFDAPGAATDWIRLRYPVVLGEMPSGVCRALAAADFGSGVSAVYGFDTFGMINADLDVAFHRPVVGEWIRLTSVTHVGPAGTGLGITLLGDEQGQFGVATQALLGYSPGPAPEVT